MTWWMYMVVTFASTMIAIIVYQVVRAEIDERRWRRMIDKELDSPAFTYRLVRDDGDGRE